VRSCLIDGEVVCCDEKGLTSFQLLRHRRNEPQAFLYAFDLLELNGTDLRREPLEVRKATLASILRKARHGVRLNEHLEHPDGPAVFQHACKMGASSLSAWVRLIAPGVHPTGSSSRTRRRLQSGGKRKRTGAGGGGGDQHHSRTVQMAAELAYELVGPQGRCICFRDRGLGRETLVSDCAVRL
jgi:hypothetical protein